MIQRSSWLTGWLIMWVRREHCYGHQTHKIKDECPVKDGRLIWGNEWILWSKIDVKGVSYLKALESQKIRIGKNFKELEKSLKRTCLNYVHFPKWCNLTSSLLAFIHVVLGAARKWHQYWWQIELKKSTEEPFILINKALFLLNKSTLKWNPISLDDIKACGYSYWFVHFMLLCS